MLKRTLVALSLLAITCGPPTVEGAESRYKANLDKLSAIMTRKPEAKATLEAKQAEFKAEHDKAIAEADEKKKIDALSALSGRMEKFIADVEPPPPAKAGGANAPSDKLDNKGATTPPPSVPATAPGGKLDGAGSGMGGAPTPAPTPAGTPSAAPTPAPATAPATAPHRPAVRPGSAARVAPGEVLQPGPVWVDG